MTTKMPLMLILASLGVACAAAPAGREASVPVIVDGKLAGSALVRDGVAYLPLRSVAKYLGLTSTYNTDAQIIIIKTPGAAHPPSDGKTTVFEKETQ